MIPKIAAVPIPAYLSQPTIAALREHRRILAARYGVAVPPAWILPVAMFGIIEIVALGAAAGFGFGDDGSAILGFLVGGVLAVVGILFGVFGWLLVRPRAEGRFSYALLRRELPSFMASIAREIGGTPHVAYELGQTVAFLERYGLASIPRAALARLYMRRPERHRVEGALAGRPVAIEAVIGEPHSAPERLRLHLPDPLVEPVGNHLFVFVAGSTGATHFRKLGELYGFSAFTVFGGAVLVRPLEHGLPTPAEVCDAIRQLGAWQPPQPFPIFDSQVTFPRFEKGSQTAEAFLSALRARDYDAAILMTGPELGHQQWLEISAPVLSHILETASIIPVAWTVTRIDEGSVTADLRVQLRLLDGRELPIEMQLECVDGIWRVWYFAGLGFERVDPMGRMSS